jgi:hypothetical protein
MTAPGRSRPTGRQVDVEVDIPYGKRVHRPMSALLLASDGRVYIEEPDSPFPGA